MTRPLHILHTESSIGWGGQEIRVLTEMRGMLDRGHHVMLLTPDNALIYPAAQKRGIPVTPIPMTKKRIAAWLALRRWLAQHGQHFDIINTHSSTDSWLTALSCATLSGLPPIVRTRHVSTAVNTHRSTRWLYQRATAHIVTTGEALRQQLACDNGYDLARMTSVRTGIDLTYFRPLNKAAMRVKLGIANKPTLGILATLRDWKGHDYLLDAWHELRRDYHDWQLLIIGDGPRREHLETRVREMQLGSRIHFVGNQDNVPEWLACLDLFTLPSYGDEGVPQSIMQAMACGLTVVSTTVGAINEAIVDGKTGIMIPPRDAPLLAHTLARFMRDNAMREYYAAAALNYAQAHFSIDTMLDRMEEIFRTMCAHQER